MKINTILSIFTPKDTKFFPLLQEAATVLDNAAELLQELFTCQDKSKIKDYCKLIKDEEVKGDKVTGRVFKELNDTFITPFDREDIDALANEMDDAIDAINRSAHKMLLYSPETHPIATVQLAEILKKGTEEIKSAIIELSSLKRKDQKVRQHAKEIKRLEEKADIVYEEGIITLFKEETSTIELIKQKEIIQELEKSANKINNVGKVLKTIIVKYA
ncbi:MAG: DUF47 family protein [Tannerella sp.]|jgi:uncharacterized protein Yka (UPF0111/DUF47 family)|nr:DUF47 family protein [Tannerella sp.]